MTGGDETRAVGQQIAGRFDGEHVLVPLLTDEVPAITDQLEVAAGLARSTGATLSMVNPVPVPDQTPETYRREIPSADGETLLSWAVEQTADSASRTDGGFLYTRNVVSSVLSAVGTSDVDTLVLSNTKHGGRLRKGLTERSRPTQTVTSWS